jgi:hypothetical protein
VEPGIVAAIVLIVITGGTAVALARQRAISWGLPGLRPSGANGAGSFDEHRDPDDSFVQTEVTRSEPSSPAARFAARLGSGPALAVLEPEELPEPEPVRLNIAPALSTLLMERLDLVEKRFDELSRAVEQQNIQIVRTRAELLAQAEAEGERRSAALEQLRSDLTALLGRLAAESQSGAIDRRLEVSADLYARLARLESALSAVTNPILLPGETYEPPAELLTEALIWENWNEVGERAFALADAYSAQRLHLSDPARDDVGHFVTALRLLLTRSVYPNLQTDPDAAQQAALRTALEEIAAELPKVRAALDREYRKVNLP